MEQRKTISDETEKQRRHETTLWVNILKQVLGTILCLASLNLALRGHDGNVGEEIAQRGNFLGVVSLLSNKAGERGGRGGQNTWGPDWFGGPEILIKDLVIVLLSRGLEARNA